MVFILVLIFIVPTLSEYSKVNRLINRIEQPFRGIIAEKYSVRGIKKVTHLRIITTEQKVIEVSPQREVIENSQVGDSIIKLVNENTVYIKTGDSIKSKFNYLRISNDVRKSRFFPDEWKEKWLY